MLWLTCYICSVMSWHYFNLMHWSKQNPHWMFEPIQKRGKMIERSTAFITWGIKVLHTHLRYHIENIHRSVSWKKKVWGRTAPDGSPGMVTLVHWAYRPRCLRSVAPASGLAVEYPSCFISVMNLDLYVHCFDSLMSRSLSRGPNNVYVCIWTTAEPRARLSARKTGYPPPHTHTHTSTLFITDRSKAVLLLDLF